MDAVVKTIMNQEGVAACRLYSELPAELCDCSRTYPKQILQKAVNALEPDERQVYSAWQGMFNAKPGLVICLVDELIVFKAKLTMKFESGQLLGTRNIAAV